MGTKKSCAARLLSAGLICTGAGMLLGARLVKTYDWRTEWFIPAPLPVVYEAMTSRSAVRRWWPSMELVDDSREDELGVGSTVSFQVHQAPEVARLAPPFRIYCVYTDVEPERRLREVVTGDLSGVLETLFERGPKGTGTRVAFNWYVRVRARAYARASVSPVAAMDHPVMPAPTSAMNFRASLSEGASEQMLALL
jgi:uncharacterized protein YndB with AHSA1/START domain